MIWTVPSLHYGIVYSLLDTVPKIGTETYKIYIGRAQPHSVTETMPNNKSNKSYWGCYPPRQ